MSEATYRMVVGVAAWVAALALVVMTWHMFELSQGSRESDRPGSRVFRVEVTNLPVSPCGEIRNGLLSSRDCVLISLPD